METRLNVTFSPVLTLELYMQPLIESDAFSAFREFAGPRSSARWCMGSMWGRTPFRRGHRGNTGSIRTDRAVPRRNF